MSAIQSADVYIYPIEITRPQGPSWCDGINYRSTCRTIHSRQCPTGTLNLSVYGGWILPCPIGQCHRSLPNCRRLGSVKNVNISDKAKNSQASPPCRRFHLLRPFWGDAAAWEPVITREIVGSVRSLPRTNNHNKERAELWVTTKTAEIFIKMYLGGAWGLIKPTGFNALYKRVPVGSLEIGLAFLRMSNC